MCSPAPFVNPMAGDIERIVNEIKGNDQGIYDWLNRWMFKVGLRFWAEYYILVVL